MDYYLLCTAVNHVRDEFGCYQFLFKFNGLSKGKSNDPKSSTLSQYVSSKFRAPIVEPGNITW